MKAYKGFDKNFQCHGYQYSVGSTNYHQGQVRMCKKGFHSCRMPIDTWNYYPPVNSRYGIAEVGGEIDRKVGDDSKLVSSIITVEKEISVSELIRAAIDWVGTAESTSHVTTTGFSRCAVATDNFSHAMTAEGGSHAMAAGYLGHAATLGPHSDAVALRNDSHAVTVGTDSCAVTLGNGGYSVTAGYGGHAVALGLEGRAVATGAHGIAACFGYYGEVMAGPDGVIIAVWFDGIRRRVVVGYVGENGIKAGTKYYLDGDHNFTEVEE